MFYFKWIRFITFGKRPTIYEKIIINHILNGCEFCFRYFHHELKMNANLLELLGINFIEFRNYIQESSLRRKMFVKANNFRMKLEKNSMHKITEAKIIEKAISE